MGTFLNADSNWSICKNNELIIKIEILYMNLKHISAHKVKKVQFYAELILSKCNTASGANGLNHFINS